MKIKVKKSRMEENFMSTYSDEDIRNCKKVTCQIAGAYLGISPLAVTLGLRNGLLPIGFACKVDEQYSENWSYHIIGERLIAYKNGRITEVQILGIEKNLNTIIEQFEEMKRDLLFILSENAE